MCEPRSTNPEDTVTRAHAETPQRSDRKAAQEDEQVRLRPETSHTQVHAGTHTYADTGTHTDTQRDTETQTQAHTCARRSSALTVQHSPQTRLGVPSALFQDRDGLRAALPGSLPSPTSTYQLSSLSTREESQ